MMVAIVAGGIAWVSYPAQVDTFLSGIRRSHRRGGFIAFVNFFDDEKILPHLYSKDKTHRTHMSIVIATEVRALRVAWN